MPLARFYRRIEARLGPLILDAYKLERVKEYRGEMLDIVTDLAERYSSTPDVVIEVVEVDQKTGEEKLVSIYTSGKGEVLFPRPARLVRVRLITEDIAASEAPVPLDVLPSYTPSEEVYIHLGRVRVEATDKGLLGVLLETDKGSRFVKLGEGMKKDSNSERGR